MFSLFACCSLEGLTGAGQICRNCGCEVLITESILNLSISPEERPGISYFLCIYLSIYLPAYLPTYLSIYLPTYIPIYLPTYLSIYRLPIYLGKAKLLTLLTRDEVPETQKLSL